MSTFLTESELSEKIRDVISGDDVKCAVAFWGRKTGTVRYFKKAKIICEIDSGATNPAVLKKLRNQSEKKENIRYRKNLHAKVYLSSKGVVVASANVSTSGLGSNLDKDAKGPGNLEAGTFHEKNSPIWHSAAEWFDQIFKKSKVVGEEALKKCEELWNSKRKQGMFRRELNAEIEVKMKAAIKKGSLLGMVCADPEAFKDIGFVFSFLENTPEAIKEAKDAAKKENIPVEPDEIQRWPSKNMYTKWGKKEALDFPSLYYVVPFG